MDNFNSPDQVFDASLAEKMATATARHQTRLEFMAMKDLVMGVVQRYAGHGYKECKWSWPLPTSQSMRDEITKELESRNFAVVPTEERLAEMPRGGQVPAREGIVISW